MELHPLEAAAVRILFCGRPALTTGVVNLRVLLGGDGQYCLAEKRKAKLHHSSRHCTGGNVSGSNSFEIGGDAEEKRESVYRVCSSDGLPDGCYYVKADRHYWVMHVKEEPRVAFAAAVATPTPPSISVSGTQVTLVSPPMPLATTASTAEHSKVEEDELTSYKQDGGSAASAPAAADAMSGTAESSSALIPAGDAGCASTESKRQRTISTKRKCTRRAKAVEEDVDNLPLINTTFFNPTPLAEASPLEEHPQQEGASRHTVSVVGDVKAMRREKLLDIPPSARPSATVAADILVACEEPQSSQQQLEQQSERRKKTSRVHVDAVAEEGKDNETATAGSCVSTKRARGGTSSGGGNKANGNAVGGAPPAEQLAELAADSSQPTKKPQQRGKRCRNNDLTAEESSVLPPVWHPSDQPKSFLSSSTEKSPLPTQKTAKAAQKNKDLRSDEVEACASASATKLTDAGPPLLSTITNRDTESAPTPAPPARKSRKSSAATSATSAAATSDAAGTATLSKIPTPPPLHSVPSAGHATHGPEQKTPSRAGTNTASIVPSPQQQVANSSAMRSPASVPQDTTPDVLYSNRSSDGHAEARRSTASSIAAPVTHPKLRQQWQSQVQQHDHHSALNSPSTRSQPGANRSASTSSLLRPLPSPLLQRQSPGSDISGGAAGSRGFHEGAMNGGGGGGGFFPFDSPALGFTQVHHTLAEEFSLDVSESESSSAASEYLCDVEE
ncbi:conserved hypothetical protein [Leishmania braziliensis MHOM/BR/75/M2904]|uniref:Uncharacterized protein n=2 Tax=Leishmania braziliensis TaxID=5660 RepID=E9AIF0_LEIBR|nr:conserved hypothetical protein [Leishmania braziliensis MHOM/BR/75/M2904]CAJ2472007.1 unnamed protein product [Leishmania braziliensis]CBZ14594.1 conserved hypothetical protein [Leishmania braziliensis MHOM/BR/75/M2904]SYZ65538.1 hypothetical_protein [Leishmania braziliensis MHOM/BR/75/M2904]